MLGDNARRSTRWGRGGGGADGAGPAAGQARSLVGFSVTKVQTEGRTAAQGSGVALGGELR